jgi:hypothetical protein
MRVTKSTIGGRTDAELERWADQGRIMCLERTGQVPLFAFTTDGCTLWPDATWQSCCVQHDLLYWCGGSDAERRTADAALRRCVAAHGGGALATLVYWGVRLGGHPWLPTFWRWGYSWPWPHGYTEPRGPGSDITNP